MSSDYKVRIYDRAGTLRYEPTDFRRFSLSRRVNSPGICLVTFDSDQPLVAAVGLDWHVEIWRRDLDYGLNWRMEFQGLLRDVERRSNEDGESEATLYCPGVLSLLGRRIVAYASGTAGRSDFTTDPAETIAKALVTYNATTAGTLVDGRVRAVDDLGITVEADAAAGTSIDFACAWQNLLSALQELAILGLGDFDLVQTGAAAWEFRWYDGLLGTDRSLTLTFGLGFGNVTNTSLRWNTIDERTVAIVGGQGEGGARSVVTTLGANYEASYNSVEDFIDARQYTTTAGLTAAGDKRLAEVQARYVTTFDVVQIPMCFYGLHYDLGDYATVNIEGYSATKKIVAVNITVDEYGEAIGIETEDVKWPGT